MACRTITLEQLPSVTIPIRKLQSAFDRCTPFDSYARIRLMQEYPSYAWRDTSSIEEISMEQAARVMHHCLRHTEYLDRFAFYFAGESVAPYEVLLAYFTQTFVKT